jgi:superfamily I DNA and RNA helicase
LEVVHGQTDRQFVADQLKDVLLGMDLDGTLYIGYPVLASADETVTVDALLVCHEHGLVVFSFEDEPPRPDDTGAWEVLRDNQDQLYFVLDTYLGRHPSLRAGRRLGVEVQPITVFPYESHPPGSLSGMYSGVGGLPEALERLPPMADGFYKPLQAALQRVTTIKPSKKRTKVVRDESRGAVLKKIEREIANLDRWQKRAAIESPEGPQRIRGLAGSGKTIVLALKAAYLHAQHPEWKIAVVFFSRSLYAQFEDLIRRFSFEHLNDEPNWQNLRVMHAWGGSDRDGLYTELAQYSGVTPRNFLYARERYGRDGAFVGVCTELLSATASEPPDPMYDAVLIDEAQDLPGQFFQLVYRFTRPPKRITWAYDELQQLSEAAMPTVDGLFGTDMDGHARVHLTNREGQPGQDIILPVCYRNTPWALTLAHALGFGIYRRGGLVQHFDDPALWTEIGYDVRAGRLETGERVTLQRDRSSYPKYFEDLLEPADAVVSRVFADEIEQADWVARSVRRNIEEDELEHDDILIILPDAYTAKQQATIVTDALNRQGIGAHLAGVTTSRDEIFTRESIAIANIYRSKGNEAPMVYVLDCQHCVSGRELITLRNTLFTAITRSRAWVRLCGWGPGMGRLVDEIEAVRDHQFRLGFTVPTAEELAKMRQIHRELTAAERDRARKAEKGLETFIRALERGEVSTANRLSPEQRAALAKYLDADSGLVDEAE